MSTTTAVIEPPRDEPAPLPLENRSFLRFLATQALGAFNDNVFKQIVLLLSVNYIAVVDFQSVVQLLFALPFLLFSGLRRASSQPRARRSLHRRGKRPPSR